ncbi:MAG TPA: hypothetical protein DDY31_14050 [Lachnospiraceae bacterium]|nr:hypothetical protein [Lachnospiraceae bacterium]HBI62312.1 hypothetical protein [Lachnospiraceae bacterium]
MKASDYIMDFIAGLGVTDVFCVTGGGAMHLNDSLGRNKRLKGVFMLHEQGAAVAAEAYARIREGIGVCLVTSGPGGTNALTALAGAYMDSIPVIFISGQAKRADLVGNQKIRQFGIQEVDIISMARPYAKYAVQIQDEKEIRCSLEKAVAVALDGRPGPVWLDIPLDIQAAEIYPDAQKGFHVPNPSANPIREEDISKLTGFWKQAKRPVLIIGNGIRLSHAVESMRELIWELKIPVLTSWNGVDLIEEDHPFYFGRPGAVGHRSANLIQQSADFVLSIGTRLSLLNSGYNFEGFLKNAVHIMVDIDPYEMDKKNLHPDLKIAADAQLFIKAVLERIGEFSGKDNSDWIAHCRKVKKHFPVFIPEQEPRNGFVSTYHLIDELSKQMSADDIYQFTSSGTTVDIAMKALRLKRGQRAFLNKSMAAMGYDVPASVGSCIGSGGRRTICVTGDGSIVMNMQELEVIKRLQLPVKIFVADNQGYSMIYQSQNGNFKGKLTGCTIDSGLTLPNIKKIAEAFSIQAFYIESEEHLAEQVYEVLSADGPAVCVFRADITQKILPKQCNFMNAQGQMESYSIEDMIPLLERSELERWML